MEISLSYFIPLLVFLLVFVVSYALLTKTKLLGSSNFVHLFVSFVVAIIFFVTPSAIQFTKIALPWIAAFMISLIFVLLVLAFTNRSLEDVLKSKILAAVIVIVLIVIFLAASINVFGPMVKSYLPGGEEQLLLFHPAVLGSVLLLVVAAVVSWVLTQSKK